MPGPCIPRSPLWSGQALEAPLDPVVSQTVTVCVQRGRVDREGSEGGEEQPRPPGRVPLGEESLGSEFALLCLTLAPEPLLQISLPSPLKTQDPKHFSYPNPNRKLALGKSLGASTP